MLVVWTSLNRAAPWLFLGGLALAALWHLRQWRQDRALALRLRERATDTPVLPASPRLSVLVAAWNEAAMIERHIRSFLDLRYPAKELILCAGGTDGTYQIARAYEGDQVRVLEQKAGEGKQAALRRCLHEATGEIVALTDADSLLDDDALARVIAPLLLAGEDAATGSSRPLEQQISDPFVVHQWCTDLFVEAHRPRYITGLLGRNCAVCREALARIGGLEPSVSTGTDYHLAKRLLRQGYRIRYVPDSAVQTVYPATVRSYWRRQSRWVRNLMVHGPAFGAWDEATMALRTSLLGLVMLGLPWLAIALGRVVLAVWGVMLLFSLMAKLRYARFAHLYRGVHISCRQVLYMPLYMVADFVAWSLPLVDLIVRRRRW